LFDTQLKLKRGTLYLLSPAEAADTATSAQAAATASAPAIVDTVVRALQAAEKVFGAKRNSKVRVSVFSHCASRRYSQC